MCIKFVFLTGLCIFLFSCASMEQTKRSTNNNVTGGISNEDVIKVINLTLADLQENKKSVFGDYENPVITIGSIDYQPPFNEQKANVLMSSIHSYILSNSIATVVVSPDFREIAREEQLRQQGYVLEDEAAALAQEKGADLFLMTSIKVQKDPVKMGYIYHYFYSFSLIDVEKNTILWVGTHSDNREVKTSQTNLALTTSFSAILPGTGQLINGKYGKGSIMMGVGAACLGVGIGSLLYSNVNLNESINASNDTNRDFYYDLYTANLAVGFGALGGYLISALWSSIDNYVVTKRQLEEDIK